MSDLNLNASASVGPSTPFCAHTYYAHLRGEGCNPIVSNGALHMLLGAADETDQWAARHDPDGLQRLEHARAVWAKRGSDDEIILLGVG
ncbi:hypothetical protein [Bradyrhizobium sp. BRP56]|uniref:hypothetical protein n=1 Tax=Bradyrhizobium sp. BRP56 TaxID=2793819 RepID=UPI001CD54BAE|nr:hypothetical protein [Bradyrhizobium sp. BRP56]MCA1399137.1 hypothetical protein [Bradyrhizobium sp. BRP56]